jgi:hypothetical protein
MITEEQILKIRRHQEFCECCGGRLRSNPMWDRNACRCEFKGLIRFYTDKLLINKDFSVDERIIKEDNQELTFYEVNDIVQNVKVNFETDKKINDIVFEDFYSKKHVYLHVLQFISEKDKEKFKNINKI